jgi:hypothetical protein
VVDTIWRNKIAFDGANQGKDREILLSLLDEYRDYKSSFAKNVRFDSRINNLSISAKIKHAYLHMLFQLKP